ncbi:unnamed protein product [Ostreobium quekettii]|uniref:Kinesin-like protein KIF6/9 C-terminal domain-containing protein n=1 Tax=Ostreobium quekettii TaxID=121088 RepID=A0A8S1IQ10_9CHLO|nr:unnamed protein product [Ostreobium quekettii]
MSSGDIRDLNELARRFLCSEADVDEIPLDTIKQIKEAFRQMRCVHQMTRGEMQQELNEQLKINADQIREAARRLSEEGDAVGEVERDAATGFHIGEAPAQARPVTVDTDKLQQERESAAPVAPSPVSLSTSRTFASAKLEVGLDKNVSYVNYITRSSEGVAKNAVLKERQGELREQRASIRKVGALVNAAKKEIDDLNARLELKKAERPADSEILVDEEYQIIGELKIAKKKYHENFDRLKELRDEMKPLLQSVAEAQHAVIECFRSYHAAGEGAAEESDGDGEQLDAAEEFERLEMGRIMAVDPDSCAFFSARKLSKQISRGRPHGYDKGHIGALKKHASRSASRA